MIVSQTAEDLPGFSRNSPEFVSDLSGIKFGIEVMQVSQVGRRATRRRDVVTLIKTRVFSFTTGRITYATRATYAAVSSVVRRRCA